MAVTVLYPPTAHTVLTTEATVPEDDDHALRGRFGGEAVRVTTSAADGTPTIIDPNSRSSR
jgi:hypothetical protein